ncbi:MAG: SRPBCC family protein [Betaproteobacteria bacterium]
MDAHPEDVWDAVRDVGNTHQRLCPGFLTDCKMDGPDARIVTFGNGMVVKELIVSIEDDKRRVAWFAVGGRLSHYNASMQIFADGDGTKAVWIADLLPNEMAGAIGGMIEQGLGAMKKTLTTASV